MPYVCDSCHMPIIDINEANVIWSEDDKCVCKELHLVHESHGKEIDCDNRQDYSNNYRLSEFLKHSFDELKTNGVKLFDLKLDQKYPQPIQRLLEILK